MQKNASQKCKKDAGAKTQCKKMQITGLICFLFAFFCIVVLPFFFCFCLVFFGLFVHLPRLLQLFPEIMFVQLVPGLICFFFSFFLLFAQVFQLFSEIMFVQLAPGLICCFFCTFLHFYFLLLSELLFSIVFSSSFFAFVLFAFPASALLICMFFALFLFFPS